MQYLDKLGKMKETVCILLGVCLYAIAVNMIFEPLGLVTGGVTGLAIVVKKLTEPLIPGGLPIWLFNLLCNIPLFIAAYLVLGKGFIKKTLFATVAMTVVLYLIPIHSIVGEDYLLGAIIGGVITGTGTGLIFMAVASTGGTDLIAMIIHKYKKYYSVPRILIMIDGVIVISGTIVFGLRNAMYAIIAIYVVTKVSDSILEGLKFAKMAYIISDQYIPIADEILSTIDRGVTLLTGQGMYSKQERNILLCVVGRKEIVQISEIAKHHDPNAFIIVTDVGEVQGEGFIEYKQ